MIEIRGLESQMAPALAALFRASREAGDEPFFHPHPLTDAEAAARARHRGRDLYYAIVDGGQVLGYGFLRGWDEGYEVPSLGIVVHPTQRGGGLGRMLMHVLHEAARRRGASRVRLTVHPQNSAARGLYADLGYVLESRDDGQLVGFLELEQSSLASGCQPNGVPLYVSTACFGETEPLKVRLDQFRRHGLEYVELGGSVTCDSTDLQSLADSGGAFLLHNYFPPPATPFVLNLASGDDGIRGRSVTFARNAIDLCARLGSPFYSVHAGFVTDPIGREASGFALPAPESPAERTRALVRFEAAIDDVLAHARSLGVGLLIENNVCRPTLRGKLLLESAEDCRALFGQRPPDGLGLLLDTGHLNVTASTYGFDRHAFMDAVAPYIGAFHVHDNDGRDDWHEPVRSGSWVLDALRAIRRPGTPVVVEAKFESVLALKQQVMWLAEELSQS